MAEERIVLQDIIYDEGDFKIKNHASLTPEETIEKIAKAICNMGDEETWERVDDNYRHYCTAQAKWALNALLEGKDA